MTQYGEWEQIMPLGQGGQSEVFLVRNPERKRQRQASLKRMVDLVPVGWMSTPNKAELEKEYAPGFAEAIYEYTREDLPYELGALKVFKMRTGGDPDAEKQALKRLLSEIEVLRKNIPGLLKLLDSNERDRWIVTEYCRDGTIKKIHSFTRARPLQPLRPSDH